MLLTDIYHRKCVEANQAIVELLQTVHENQLHPGDLLLAALGGFYLPNKPFYAPLNASLGVSGYKLKEFDIHDNDVTRPEFETNLVIERITGSYNTTEHAFYIKRDEVLSTKDGHIIRAFWREQETVAGLEFLVYLKLWEMDSYMTTLFQVAKLALGERYDWYLELSSNNRKSTDTLHKYTKNEVRRSIINCLEKSGCNLLLNLISTSYDKRLRNAIAHSQYYFSNGQIILTKYNEQIALQAWMESIYPLTLALYSSFAESIFQSILTYYKTKAVANGNRISVVLGNEQEVNLVFHPDLSENGRWSL